MLTSANAKPTPGTRIVMKGPWPERVGLEGVVVDPAVFHGLYPHDRRSGNLIVKLDNDPLNDPVVHGDSRWTCVVSPNEVDVVSKTPLTEGHR